MPLPALQIEARGVIYDAAQAPASEAIAYFTSLCRLSSGTLLAGFQLGPGKHAPGNTARLCRSRDGGNTWQPLPHCFATSLAGVPGSLSGGEVVETQPGKLLLFTTWFDRSDPNRPLFDPTTEGILHSKQLVCQSTDEGASWGPWRVVPTPGLTGCATTGPVLRWADGAIAYAFESFKEYDDPLPAQHGAWLLVSRNGGGTFEEPFLVARHPRHEVYYWDQRLCTGPRAGDFVALFWTHNRVQKRDLNVHLLRASLRDGRRARQQPRETSIPGQIAAPALLDDGRLLAFVVDRGRPGTMTLWQSSDEGATWPAEAKLVVHTHDEQAVQADYRQGIDFAQYWEDMGKWSFGHPAVCRLGEGRLMLAWYAGTPQRMSIHWARVRT
jgi:hypothetical protein